MLKMTVTDGGNSVSLATEVLSVFVNAPEGNSWTILVYVDGDNNLEQYAEMDINEMETVGSSGNVNVVVQYDPYLGLSGSPLARRYYITADSDNATITSPVLQNLSQVDMGSEAVLKDFITWGITEYPADRYCLVLWNHGGGWVGGLYDDTPEANSSETTCMSLAHMARAMENALDATGVEKLDIVACDMCLMGMIEVADVFAPHADYLVASSEPILCEGFNYKALLEPIVANPGMSSRNFCRIIVDQFMNTCDVLLQEYADTYYPYGMSVVDLSVVPCLTEAFRPLASSISSSLVDEWKAIYLSAYASQQYGRYYEYEFTGFVDLGDFTDLYSMIGGDAASAGNAALVKKALGECVVYNRTNEDMEYSTGLSFFLPGEGFSYYYDMSEYANLAFCRKTGWGGVAAAFGAIAESASGQTVIYDLQVTGGSTPSENYTCSAVMDAFMPMQVALMVTGTEQVSGMWEDYALYCMENITPRMTFPNGREIPVWGIGNESLSMQWDGTVTVIANGTAEMKVYPYPLSDYMRSEFNLGSLKPLCVDAEVTLANGDVLDEAYLLIDKDSLGYLVCFYFDWNIYEYLPYNLSSGDIVNPYIPVFEVGYGLYNGGYTAEEGLALADDPVFERKRLSGDYYVGFYLYDKDGREYFEKILVTLP